MTRHRLRDRKEAGGVLARLLHAYRGSPDVLVLALPRGGVPIGYEIALDLGAPLDVFLVRKLGAPGHEELAIGAIAAGGARFMNEEIVQALGVTEDQIERIASSEQLELDRRARLYRGDRPPPVIAERIVILVDDGLATGATMRAAAAAISAQNPRRLVVGVPVAAAETCELMRAEVDEIVCAMMPDPFHAVGLWYEDFSQTTDEEVHDLLRSAARAFDDV